MFAALSEDGRRASVRATRQEQAALVAAHDADQDAREPGSDAPGSGGVTVQSRAAENRGLATEDEPPTVKIAISGASGVPLRGVPVLTMAWP
jgi:hypothetical protein